MSCEGRTRPKWAASVAHIAESALYHGGIFTLYIIVALGIVGTWGEPDLIDALVARIGGITLECQASD